MRPRLRSAALAAVAIVALVAGRAVAQHGDLHRGPAPHGLAVEPGPHAPAAGHGDHAEHGAHAEHDEKAPPGEINWWHGLLGEKEGAEPGVLWRAPGEPAPFLASILNFALLVFIVVKYGKKPLSDALVKRKETIMKDIEEASKMRAASEERLAAYQAKLDRIQDDVDRVRREFREQGERDRERIVKEANERRERMKKDAEFMLTQELKQMKIDLLHETVEEAVRSASDLLAKKLTPGDHDRFAETFLAQLPSSGKGGGPAGGLEAVAKGGAS